MASRRNGSIERHLLPACGSPSRSVLTAAAASIFALAASCSPAQLGPGYPLYPDPQNRQADDAVARLVEQIGSVDGQDVSGRGQVFDLLPGCHVVELHGEMQRTNTYVTWVGQMPNSVVELRMKAGHRYFIHRELIQDMGSRTGKIVVIGQDEDRTGGSTMFSPTPVRGDFRSCTE
jgi:hypothetical protein